MPATITETKYAALKSKLRELFELDKSDLDFGIYRIMAAKNKDVSEFLDRQLKEIVREKLEEHGAGASNQVQTDLDKVIVSLKTAEMTEDEIEKNRKVIDLRAKLASAGVTSGADLEADIYNHLLAFFSRYYDEGDFISKRRYKGDVYAIPYAGEEVTLHWANKDQYYIKSGEWHKDYRFKVAGGGTSGGTVHFKLVAATQEKDNVKEADSAKRRFILVSDNPVEVSPSGSELTLMFEFRAPTEAEKTALAENKPVRIFGGKFDKDTGGTKGDEREQFNADAEVRALAALTVLTSRGRQGAGSPSPVTPPLQSGLVDDWKARIAAPGSAATEAMPSRTLLGKHLNDYTARNTFDYFIHKDLGGFLSRELDFYIKNEVVRLDDLESLPPDHLARVQGKIKAIRTVAGRVIDFLAAIENFQKKLWLKKKFVLETNWLVTIDRIPAELRDIVANNEAQWKEWESLGFKPVDPEQAGLYTGPKWGTREYLEANDKLIVDTQFFNELSPSYKSDVLASACVFGDFNSLEDATVGILIQSENWGGLSLLQDRFRSDVKSIYIDPPYNTGGDGFAYKDQYQHSSWLALLADRLRAARHLMSLSSGAACNLNDIEDWRMRGLIDVVFGPQAYVSTIVTKCSTTSSFRTVNLGPVDVTDRILLFAKDRSNISYTPQPVEKKVDLQHFGRFVVNRQDSPDLWEYKPVRLQVLHNFGFECESTASGMRSARERWGEGAHGVVEAAAEQFALDNCGRVFELKTFQKPSRWLLEHIAESKREVDKVIVVRRENDEDIILLGGRQFYFLSRGVVDVGGKKVVTEPASTLWTDIDTNNLRHEGDVEFPAGKKPTKLIERLVRMFDAANGSTVLDFFAGSGSTGHAVVNLNRQDDIRRRFVLIEMGSHFHTVLKPRIIKVLYSPDWKDGRAQTHGQGTSALVKYFALESYEDALNNLPAPKGVLPANEDVAVKDALLTYALDLELGPHLLNLDIFADPWSYSINAQQAGSDEIARRRVDLVETFNYLIGLKVKSYGPMERYNAEFERAEHAEGLGRLKVKGRLGKVADGPFVFHRVEGEINDADNTRVLVVWRKLTGNAEEDAAVLDAWMARHGEDTKERSGYREYQRIYVNGPVTLAQPTQDIRTVYPLEQTFKDRMFEGTDGGDS